jgi:fructose-bisphosphate aldolase class I
MRRGASCFFTGIIIAKNGKLMLMTDLPKLEGLAQNLVAPPKGLLAADESTGTITKRFAAVGLTSTPELNRKYRQLFFTAPEVEQYLSGVIMFDETVRQKTDAGVAFPEYLSKRGITPGIKVDEGREPLGEKEEVTKGLAGLPGRLPGYKKLGLFFTKWRAPIIINGAYPSVGAVGENAKRMAEFAAISQENGFVPIVEPEVLIAGNHTTARCEEVTLQVLQTLFAELAQKEVELKGVILKTNMVLPGRESGVRAQPLEVANATLRALRGSVPAAVPGVVFLSGGQSPDEATQNLNAINKLKGDAPWELSFSFARALQEEALGAWQGRDENVGVAQAKFVHRARLVSLARQGKL